MVYTITTTLVPDTGGTQRASQQSAPAVVKNDQTIVLGALPSSVVITTPPTVTVTATSMSNGAPNGLQVVFGAAGSCAVGSQSITGNVSSATIALSGTGSCTVTAAQPGTTSFNAANSVSGTFMVLAQGSNVKSQTINFATLPNAQYGGSFTLSATSSVGLPVSFTASGPCTTSGKISGIGMCAITASAAGNSTYSAASLTQSFTIFPAVLKVTANNVTSVYGQALPPLTYGYSGFIGNDTAAVISGGPALSTTATSSSVPGSYPITVSTGTLATTNYSFLYVSGTLTVQPKPQTITFTINPPASALYNTSFTVAATATSGGAVAFTSAGACSNLGAVYTMTNSTGTCSVIANQPGNAAYAAAPTITKTVIAAGPLLSVSASSIDFGTLYVGSIAAKTITLTNTGTAPATITDPLLSIVRGGDSSEFLALSLCPRQLGVGKTCFVTIAFLAGPYYTPQTATLQIMSNAPGSPQPVALNALVIHPVATVTPSGLSFGTIKHATSSTLNATLTNTGATLLSLTGISVTGTNATYFTKTSNCGSSLAVGASCTVAVKFTPPVTGKFSANLTFVDNAQNGGGTQTVPLSGTGN